MPGKGGRVMGVGKQTGRHFREAILWGGLAPGSCECCWCMSGPLPLCRTGADAVFVYTCHPVRGRSPSGPGSLRMLPGGQAQVGL